MFKNRRLFKDFVCGIKEHKYTTEEVKNILETLPNKVIRRIGKEIICSDFNGYNDCSICGELAWFDNLDRWQKELYIEKRLYKLCS